MKAGEAAIEDEMVEWHHQRGAHGSEQTSGDREGQGILACCSPWDHKESRHDLGTEQQQHIFLRIHPLSNVSDTNLSQQTLIIRLTLYKKFFCLVSYFPYNDFKPG